MKMSSSPVNGYPSRLFLLFPIGLLLLVFGWKLCCFDVKRSTHRLSEHFDLEVPSSARRYENGPRSLIIGGAEVAYLRYPYMASLAFRGRHKCGGTLVAPDIILTAAHCVSQIGEVHVGPQNMHGINGDNAEVQAYENFVIEKSIMHPRYYSHPSIGVDVDPYDVAVLKIFGKSKVRTFATINRDVIRPRANDELLVLGWGTTDASDPSVLSDTLMQSKVAYLANEECIKAEGNAANGIWVGFEEQIIDVSLCTAKAAACEGDSGGPLLLDGVQVGIVSASFGCGHPSLPGLNVRLSHVSFWIREKVCELSEDAPESFGCEKAKESRLESDEMAVFDSLEPTMTIPFLTIVIQLDSFPTETGYSIEALSGDNTTTLIAIVYPGTYGNEMANTLVTEKVVLLPTGPEIQRYYRFTMTDNEHDGLTPGMYQVWFGLPEVGQMLIEGGDFFLEDPHIFQIPLPPTQLTPASNGKGFQISGPPFISMDANLTAALKSWLALAVLSSIFSATMF